jgi:osmotically-inducible protein OsmY
MSNDISLKQCVLDELEWEPSVNAAHIGVTTNAGVVTLSGHVASYLEKRAAENAAVRVKAVKAIVEDIEVRLPFEFKRGDEEIAIAALHRFAWDRAVPADAIKIEVADGWVTLTGQVAWHYQQAAAALDVGGLLGVVGVSNNITIMPKPSAPNMRKNILAALRRSWFDAKAIDVKVDEGNVRLSGTVRGWSERESAASTAWAAPGTVNVENLIRVD